MLQEVSARSGFRRPAPGRSAVADGVRAVDAVGLDLLVAHVLRDLLLVGDGLLREAHPLDRHGLGLDDRALLRQDPCSMSTPNLSPRQAASLRHDMLRRQCLVLGTLKRCDPDPGQSSNHSLLLLHKLRS